MQLAEPIVLFDIDYTLFDTKRFKESDLKSYNAFDEVKEILTRLKTIAVLGVFSEGKEQFQKTKLEKTEMMNFFTENDIHIFGDKDINLIKVLEKYKGKRIFLVDDKLQVLYSAKKYMPQIITVWVKRGPYAKTQQTIENFAPSATIDSLSNLLNIVLSN